MIWRLTIMVSEEAETIAKARALFEAGAQAVYLAVEDDRILVMRDAPARAGVVLTARSILEVESFVRDLPRRTKR